MPRRWWAWPVLAAALLMAVLVGMLSVSAFARQPANIQIFVTRDVTRPATVRLVLKTVSLPFGVTSMSCDGVAFRRGFPDQALYVGIGWYVDLPARAAGTSYSCAFANALTSRTLAVPAEDAASDARMAITTPAAHVTLSRGAAVVFSFATTCEAGAVPTSALIADGAGHSALARQWGCGPAGGSGSFAPPERAAFAAGPGRLALYAERERFLQAPGWQGASIISYTGTSVPVVWS